MKLVISVKLLERIILIYPVLLGLIYMFNIQPFFITAPYFFLILLILLLKLALKKKVYFHKGRLTNILLSFILLLVSLINFSSVRYSLPIMFTVFILVFQLYVYSANNQIDKNANNQVRKFFFIYVGFSFFFLFFLGFSNMEVGNRFKGFTGSPTTYSAIVAIIFILLDTKNAFSKKKRIFLYLFVLFLVCLTKTRLVILFLLMYPVIIFSINKFKLSYSFVYLFLFGLFFFVYPLYEWVAEHYPNIAASRYEGGKDTSFGLRNYLYILIERDFYSGTNWQMLFGKGNESSRIIVEKLFNSDLFPHNDYIRIINDWGLFGGGVFFVLLYRISKVNLTTLMISIMYLLLFYSNMIFNLFLVSLLILSSVQSTKFDKKRSR